MHREIVLFTKAGWLREEQIITCIYICIYIWTIICCNSPRDCNLSANRLRTISFFSIRNSSAGWTSVREQFLDSMSRSSWHQRHTLLRMRRAKSHKEQRDTISISSGQKCGNETADKNPTTCSICGMQLSWWDRSRLAVWVIPRAYLLHYRAFNFCHKDYITGRVRTT